VTKHHILIGSAPQAQ